MNMNKLLSESIAKNAMRVTRKPIAALRRDVADLKRQVAELKRLVRTLQKNARLSDVKTSTPETETGKATRIRPTDKTVRKLRARLGLTQAAFGKLVGVSPLTVCKWEKSGGRIRMRGRALEGFASVLAMGKRHAKAALAETASFRK